MKVGDVVVSVTTGRERKVLALRTSYAVLSGSGNDAVNLNPVTGLPVGYALKEAK